MRRREMENKYIIGDIPKLIFKLTEEIAKLSKFLFHLKKNINLYANVLGGNLEFLEWINKSIDLRTKDIPKVIKQREIFYCELGINIGSEQGLKRPVVILQNDVGNTKADTTIVAPITTYEHKDIVEKDGKSYIRCKTKDGTERLKLIDFYEIPVEIEDGYTQKVDGYINIVHMREISKKRLSLTPVAKITDDNLNLVNTAIIKNLDIKINIDKKA
jgi:mRNA interferase MazF